MLGLPLVLAAVGCAAPRLPPPDPSASLRVSVILERHEDVTLRTFTADPFRVPPRPALPSAWLPLGAGGAGMVAVSPERPRRSWVFVLEEDTRGVEPFLTVFESLYPQQGEAGVRTPKPDRQDAAAPPCESWFGFFVKRVGERPRKPIVLSRWQNDGPSRSFVIDPAQHTLSLPRVPRFSTRDVRGLRNRKATFILVVKATAGTKPFLLLGLVRRPNGSYTETVFMSDGKEKGWGGFVHTPEGNTEISFYALDDSAPLRSPCRAR